MNPPTSASHFLYHPIGTVVEFAPHSALYVRVTSRREGRPDKSFGVVGKHLARSWYNKWLTMGFAPTETKETTNGPDAAT